MEEFEPKKKYKIFTKEFLAKYSYVFVLAIFLIVGVSYGLTFFVQNKKITTGNINVSALNISFTNRSINATNLYIPNDLSEGLLQYSKEITITNNESTNGRVKLSLTRTSGLHFEEMSYAVIINGAIQEIGDVPSSGQLITTAVMGNETLDVDIRLWPKIGYTGGWNSFVGEVTPEITYIGQLATSIDSPAGKYVKFNCNGSTCEVWQIVKVENGRLVLTRQADYSGATSRVNSNKYFTSLSFNDSSLITSVSNDTNHKNVYLAKTVRIASGSGTIDAPYVLENNEFREGDRKVIATISYEDENNEQIATQNIYYDGINYVSGIIDDPHFSRWNDGYDPFNVGDVLSISSDATLYAEMNNGNVLIHIIDSNNGAQIPNDTFEIYSDSDCTDLVLEFTSIDTPSRIFLSPGTYYLVNTRAADGYNRVLDTLEKSVNNTHNNSWTIMVLRGVELPHY